jgi:hypothetical protein
LLVEPPIGVTPSPIVAAMAASVGGLLLLPTATKLEVVDESAV